MWGGTAWASPRNCRDRARLQDAVRLPGHDQSPRLRRQGAPGRALRTDAGRRRAALSLALRERARVDAEADITPDTKLAALAEAWLDDFERQDRSPTTVAAYRGRIDKHILPALGNVRVRELTVGLVDRHLRAVEANHGAAMAKQTKTVLGQVIGLAVRHDALTQNPVRDASPISTKPKNAPRAFTAPQAAQLMAALTYDDQAVARDLPGPGCHNAGERPPAR